MSEHGAADDCTTGDLVVEAMTAGDAGPVAALLTSCFAEDLHAYVAYCGADVANYLAVMAGCPPAHRDQHLLVARSVSHGVVGFAEFRSLGDGGELLSYVCIAPAARGQRLAERMVRSHLEQRAGARTLDLDVFAQNTVARRLYERVGLAAVSETEWWARDLAPAAEHAPDGGILRVRDWHLTAAALDRYGFGMMEAEWRGQSLRLGLPSRSVVRVSDPRWFADDALLAAAAVLVPTLEQCLMIGRPSEETAATSRRLLSSVRMRGSLPLNAMAP